VFVRVRGPTNSSKRTQCVSVCEIECVCKSSWAKYELALEAHAAGRHCVCVCVRERECVCQFVGRALACSRGAGCGV